MNINYVNSYFAQRPAVQSYSMGNNNYAPMYSRTNQEHVMSNSMYPASFQTGLANLLNMLIQHLMGNSGHHYTHNEHHNPGFDALNNQNDTQQQAYNQAVENIAMSNAVIMGTMNYNLLQSSMNNSPFTL